MKPLILIDNKRVIGSSREVAMVSIDAKADALEKRASKIRLMAETATSFEQKSKMLALALMMLGQSQGLRMAHIIINEGSKDDKKRAINFWKN